MPELATDRTISRQAASPELRTNVVVVTWNARDFTITALQRLFETTHHPYSLTVVDNGSTDGTTQYLGGLAAGGSCKRLEVVRNARNLGPGAAYNQGYQVSRKLGCQYTALCNNDLYFQNYWLDRLEKTLDADMSIGILGTLQPTSGVRHPYSAKADAKAALTGGPEDLTPSQELKRFFCSRDFDTGARDIIGANGGGIGYLTCPPDAVPTSCALVRNSAVEEVGFVADPRYEIYGTEDIDLSWELGKLGYRCAINNDVYVHHFRHRSVRASGLDFKKCLQENNRKFVVKWFPTIAALLRERKRDDEDPAQLLTSESNDSFRKLRRINANVGFWRDGKLVEPPDIA